jgi:hypothetical protein
MTDLIIGYGKGEIEPKVAPLVKAVQAAGFVTFSSCEGHPGDETKLNYTNVGFYASEAEARRVHQALFRYRPRLSCSWNFRAGFVCNRNTHEWMLGWTLENWGIIDPGDDSEFLKRTMEAAWNTDIPLLAEMFGEIQVSR